MKTLLKPMAIVCWKSCLPALLLAGSLGLPAANLSEFGYANMATGNSRPLLVIMANFPAPSPRFANGTNVAYYSNLVFSTAAKSNSVNNYFNEMSNGNFQWTPTRVLLVQMSEPERREHMSSDSNYASNIIYKAVSGSRFDWDIYFAGTKDPDIRDKDLGIMLISNDKMLSARWVAGIKPPHVSHGYHGLVYVGIHNDTFATMCHETSHILGAQDFYGIWGMPNPLSEQLSLMGYSVGLVHLDPWHKMQFGWSTPQIRELNSGGSAVLEAAQQKSVIAPIILYDTNRGPSEFFLVEYRTQTIGGGSGGYDANVAGNGMVIWHVAHQADKTPPLMAELSWPNAERTWRECLKCRSLTYGTSNIGNCADGGIHEPFKDDHGLIKNDPSSPGQSGWRRCTKCKSLFYGPNQATSNCPGGSTHLAASDNYTLITDTNVLAHHFWRRCTKCETLFLGWLYHEHDGTAHSHSSLTTNGVCIVGSTHNADTNIMYTLPAFWAVTALQPEAYPDLRRGESDVWPANSTTPWLWWYDQTPACVSINVRPFATGDRSITVDWINQSGPWVDFQYSGGEAGTFSLPFNSLTEGVSAVRSGGYLYIKVSRSTQGGRITKPMHIQSYGGRVIIGR